MLPQLFFGYYAVVITLLSLLVVMGRNPVHSVMWMLLLFFHIAGLYLFLNAEFIAAIQVIVYAGAILVLFLFVVLLMTLKEEIRAKKFVGSWPAGLFMAGTLFVAVVSALGSYVQGPMGVYTTDEVRSETNVKVMGRLLYTE
jgi:NADH-quinone oxidoreductase subunit J